MTIERFYSYRGYRYFWANFALVALATAAYLIDNPPGGRNGGTVLGYTLGGVATAGILYLLWFGIRKRSYYSMSNTVMGCLSAHVWLGVALAIIVPLHAGFSIGLNVHTLAYLVMMIVVVSGIWGALAYIWLPPHLQSHRGGGTIFSVLEQIQMVNRELEGLAGKKSDAFVTLLQRIDIAFQPSLVACYVGGVPTLDKSVVATLLARTPEQERDDAAKVVGLINKKRELIERAREEARLFTGLRLWLYLHVPLSIALIVVLAIHIFSVFYNW